MSAQKVVFGSSQERKLFPLHYAPDRLGIQMSRRQAPHVGPGCYDNHEFGTIVYNLEKTPGSKKGYSLCARTAARFPPDSKSVVPSPWQYQPDQSTSRIPLPGKTPFNSTTQRFKRTSCTAEESPGKVSWPMRFGSPDWSRLPQLDKRSFWLNSEKEYQKLRSTLAYLSLYY
uniref:Si:ch211-66i15.4 n=1 Tax=Sphaeramia orbicularis TaxID=375764 RepID=A0A672YPH1_9TELE